MKINICIFAINKVIAGRAFINLNSYPLKVRIKRKMIITLQINLINLAYYERSTKSIVLYFEQLFFRLRLSGKEIRFNAISLRGVKSESNH